MKKSLINLLVVLLIVLALVPVLLQAALAEGIGLVYDSADLLNYSEWERLLSKAEAISERRKCDVVVYSVSEATSGGDIYQRAKSAYEQNGYGYGADKSCLIFYVNMSEREFSMETFGKAGSIFTQRNIDDMLDNHILPLLRENRNYEAFKAYLDEADKCLAAYSASILRNRLLVTFVPSLLVALVVCLVLKSRMKTAVTARRADRYIPANGFQLTLKEDRFLFRTETRRRIESSSSGGHSGHGSSGGGSSSSSSRSSPGRSGKF